MKPDKNGWWWLYDERRMGWEVVLIQETWPGNFLFTRQGTAEETNTRDYDSWGESIPEPNTSVKGWYCPTCDRLVQNEHVTYEETHDIRCGGCGNYVEPNAESEALT